MITTVGLQAYGRTLEVVLEFKYLGRGLTGSDDEWADVIGNLSNARRQWERMLRILGR